MRWYLTAALTALCSPAPDTLLFTPIGRWAPSEDPAFVPVDNALFLKNTKKGAGAGKKPILFTCRLYISTVNKSLTDSLGWITSAFKGQTAADFASFCRGKLGSHFDKALHFGQKCARVVARYCLHDSHQLRCSFLTASPSSKRCVTAAPLRIRSSDKGVSAVRKMRTFGPSSWSDVRQFNSSVCLWPWNRWQVCPSPVSQRDWQDAAARAALSGGAVPGPRCWKLSRSATWPRQDQRAALTGKVKGRPG